MKMIFLILIAFLVLSISSCDNSVESGEKSMPKKEWVDIRGTEVLLQSADGVKLCVYVPNGVFASNHKDSLTIKFEDFDDFSKSSVKRPIDYKIGVSSIFISPKSSDDLNKLRARLIDVGEVLIFNYDGFEIYKSKVSDDKTSLKIINIEDTISISFYSGKLLREKYEKNTYLEKLITEISEITNTCKKE